MKKVEASMYSVLAPEDPCSSIMRYWWSLLARIKSARASSDVIVAMSRAEMVKAVNTSR